MLYSSNRLYTADELPNRKYVTKTSYQACLDHMTVLHQLACTADVLFSLCENFVEIVLESLIIV